MNRISIIVLVISAIFIGSCSKVPFTGRKQVNLLPESMLLEMSFANYSEFISQNQVASSSDPNSRLVNTAGNKIAASVEKYLKDNDQSKRVKNFQWKFNLVKDNTPNAWCMPGGKVVVYEGILPFTQSEAGLATVMGHEIAHAIARHGNERLSQQLAVAGLGIGLEYALREKPEETKQLFMMAYGVGSQLGTLAYSRAHESESDKLGMVFMAMAGYDPTEAIKFWQRFSQAGGEEPPEFLSTHPSNSRRIRDLKEFLPEAMKYYKQ